MILSCAKFKNFTQLFTLFLIKLLTIRCFFEKIKVVIIMKKILCLFFVCIIIAVSFCGCGKEHGKIAYNEIIWEYEISKNKVSVKPAFESVGEDLRKYESDIPSEVYVPPR